jgi:hypothetical protein
MAESDDSENGSRNGLLMDEAYEMYHTPAVSAMAYIKV